MDVERKLTMQLTANKAARAEGYARGTREQGKGPRPGASCLLPLYLPTEVTVVPLDGEICSNRGSIKGVKEEEDLCFWSVLLAD